MTLPHMPAPTLSDDPPDLLLRLLSDHGHAGPQTRWTRLDGGRSNRVWRVTSRDRDLVVKLAAARRHAPLFPNDPRAEYLAMTALSGTGLAPEPVDLLGHRGDTCLVYNHVPGTVWRPSDTAAVARALGRLHRQPPPDLRHVATDPDRITVDGQDLARQLPAHLAGLLPAPRTCTGPTGPVPAFLHGDPVPNNILIRPGGITLIDWQCPAIGHPAHDYAIFLSPAMQCLYGAGPLTQMQESAFLAAIEEPMLAQDYLRLAPVLHWRIAAYCLWRAAIGEVDYLDAAKAEVARLEQRQD